MAGAYEVTATRKRPQDFDRLVGQDFVVSTLENAIKENRIAHAYLFSGPRGVGKTSSARLLAKALNCEKGPTPHPCGVCDSCRSIAEGKSVDVIEIDGASNTSVNDIRTIREEVLYPPQSSRYKIYIIDEVHMLSTSAFNALLKTIEEPPEYIIFIFATTELQKVPATIRSRCQQFRFSLISQDIIIRCLRSAAEDLGIEADEDALFWIAKESTGSMRDAYTLFDQVAAFSGNHITIAKIREKLSIAGSDAIARITRASLGGDRNGMLAALSELFASGVSADQIVKDTAEFFRMLMLWKAGVRKPDVLGTAASDIPEDIAAMLTDEQIGAALRAVMNLYRDLRYSLSPRIEIELFFLRIGSLPQLVSPEELVRRLEKMKEGIAEGSVVVRTPRKATLPSAAAMVTDEPVLQKEEAPDTEPAAEEEEAPEAGETEDADSPGKIEDEIGGIAEALRKMGKVVSARYISSVKRIEEGDGTITFVFSKPLAYNSLRNDERSLASAVASATGRTDAVKLRLEEEKSHDEDFSQQMRNLKAFFGGTLVKTGKGEKTEERKEEKNVPEHEPVRTYEGNGLDTEPDEDD